MKNKIYEKEMRKDGALCIPAAVRNRLGLKPHTPITLNVTADGRIFLQPKVSVCPICGKQVKDTDLNKWTGVCKDCSKQIENEIAKYACTFEQAVDRVKDTYVKKNAKFTKR